MTTTVTAQSGTCTWLSCASLCLLGLCLLFPFFVCWVPFCVRPLMDAYHACPNCHRNIGVYPACGLNLAQ